MEDVRTGINIGFLPVLEVLVVLGESKSKKKKLLPQTKNKHTVTSVWKGIIQERFCETRTN